MTILARRALTATLAALLLSSRGGVLAQAVPAPAAAEDTRMLPYVAPGRLVDIGGRRINLHCTGTDTGAGASAGAGAVGPTVILMAGLFSWSLVWYKTQPVIAQTARVCAFDRAGYGFSDPAPRPQILSDLVDDLHAALHAGSIPGPYVLVGHSLGGIEARLYAQRWPKEVAGMVLVDTSPAAEGLIDETQPGFDAAMGRERYPSDMLYCALLVEKGPLDPSRPKDQAACSVSLPKDTPAAFRAIWPRFFTPYYFADKVSLLSSLYTHRYDSVDHRRLGAMPLVVLSVKNTWGDDTPAKVRFGRSYSKWIVMHEALAKLSSRGVHRMIEGSSHHIQLDQPQAVIDAVHDVLRQLHTAAPN